MINVRNWKITEVSNTPCVSPITEPNSKKAKNAHSNHLKVNNDFHCLPLDSTSLAKATSVIRSPISLSPGFTSRRNGRMLTYTTRNSKLCCGLKNAKSAKNNELAISAMDVGRNNAITITASATRIYNVSFSFSFSFSIVINEFTLSTTSRTIIDIK